MHRKKSHNVLTFSSPDLTKSNFEPGPYNRGEGFTFVSDELLRREFTYELKVPEAYALMCLNWKVWLEKNIFTQVAASYLIEMMPITLRSAQTYLKALTEKGMLQVSRVDHQYGNVYLVEPVFIWSNKWHDLKHIEHCRAIHAIEVCKNCVTDRRYANPSQLLRKVFVSRGASPGVGLCKICVQISTVSSVEKAHRVSAPKETEGGEEVPPSELEGDKRTPCGVEDSLDRAPQGPQSERSADADDSSGQGQKAPAFNSDDAAFQFKSKEIGKLWMNGKIKAEEYEARIAALAKEYGKETFFKANLSLQSKKNSVGTDGRASFAP